MDTQELGAAGGRPLHQVQDIVPGVAPAPRDISGGRRAWRVAAGSVVIVPLAAALLALAAAFAADRLYADRVLPGVTVAGIDVGALSGPEATRRLEAAVAGPWSAAAVVFRDGDRAWRTTNGELGLRLDVAGAVEAALAYGRSGTPVDRAYAWAGALQRDAHLALSVRADGPQLERWIGRLASEIDRPAVDGRLAVGAAGLAVTSPGMGARLDTSAAAGAALAVSALADREIALSVRPIHPSLDESGFREALARARAVVTPLVVTAEDRRVAEDAAGLATLLRIERVAARPGELPPVAAGAVAPAQRYRYEVSLDGDAARTWSAALAGKLDRPGANARFAVNARSEVSVVPGIGGIRIDQPKVAALLMEELLRPVEGIRELAAPTVADATAFTTEQATEWLPKLTRTSSFTTSFPVNASRHANIATGSAQFDGVVIMPGQTFSFWELVGPVTTERGYAYAGAIINNRSDESVIGGGLCQVSTTLFNAVARLGYEIVERHAHGYLIERYPVGLDAAVFLPGSDLRWRNDTPSPVFLWSWVGDTSVTFDVWGVPTGRTVTFGAPLQGNFRAVPADQPADPAFPAGYAVRGRSVVVTRTVTAADGSPLHSDRFVSWYAPVWGGPAPDGGTLTVR